MPHCGGTESEMKTMDYSGVITNYVCTAACRHCMFASSPDRPKDFITEEMSENIAKTLKKTGTTSVHIGGGEPFMNFQALCSLIKALSKNGISIDYIETNAFWCKDDDFVKDRLETLRSLGVTSVMVSVDPFHIEFVPLERAIRLCVLLDQCDFDYFVWKERYLRKFISIGLDRTRTYTKDELCTILGDDYIPRTAEEYGLGMNGKALFIAEDLFEIRPAEDWLSPAPCRSVTSTSHCHIDLYGNIVPPGCPGISAEANDFLNTNFSEEKYPVLSRLAHGGTSALYSYACENGFTPDKKGYPSRCSLCFSMRKYLNSVRPSADLSPRCFYESMSEADK